MLEYLEAYGDSANPIVINLEIARHPEVSWPVMQRAASDVMKCLLPRMLEIDRVSSDESHGSASVIIQSLQTLLHPSDPPKLIDGVEIPGDH